MPNDRAIPFGEDGWHHPPARSRSHTVSGTQDAQHPTPADSAAFTQQPSTVGHSGRRASLLASAFGSLLSPTTSRSPTTASDASSAGLATPPNGPGVGHVGVHDDDDHLHMDELHDAVSDYAPLSRVWSAKARRSSWSPAAPAGDYATSAPSATGGGVMAWVKAQQGEEGRRAEMDAAPTSPATSLFRRFSLGGSAHKPGMGFGASTSPTSRMPANESAIADAPMSADEEANRLGRSMTRRGSSARRLSPMSEKLLRGHYEF